MQNNADAVEAGAEQHRQSAHVVQWQAAQPAVIRPVPQAKGGGGRAPEVVGVGDHGRLGPPAGAGGKKDGLGAVQAKRDGRERPRPGRGQRPHPNPAGRIHRENRPAGFGQIGGHSFGGVVAQQPATAGMGELPGQLRPGEAGVERHQHQPQAGRRMHQADVFRPVGHEDGQQGTRPGSHRRQPATPAGHLSRQGGVGPPLFAKKQRHLLRRGRHPLRQPIGHRSAYGRRGNLLKSGSRFSLKALRPSLPSSVM